MEKPLPPKYYHSNFNYLIQFVVEKYAHILEKPELDFLHLFADLPEDAQCWFIRFSNRKGSFFKYQDIAYEELSSISTNFEILEKKEFIGKLSVEKHTEYIQDILHITTKPELQALFSIPGMKTAKKEIWVNAILETFMVDEILNKISKGIPVLKVNFEREVNFIKFLFFGNRYLDMTEFVLADLGLVSYHNQAEDSMVARFSNRKEAEDKWMLTDQQILFSELKDSLTIPELSDWFLTLKASLQDLSDIAIPSWEKLQLRIAKFFEQKKAFHEAILVYDDLTCVPARERKVRCLHKLGLFEEASSLCGEMIANPQNADEQFFAIDFTKTISGKKNKKQTTLELNEAQEIQISVIFKYRVEIGALNYFMDQGYEGGFSENFSWRALFGLFFWDIIFDPSLVAFHHPFQRRPSDLHLPAFYQKREKAVHELLDSFKSNEQLWYFLENQYIDHHGKANPFVIWMEEIWIMVEVLANKIALEKLKAVLLKMAENIVENTRGLPDLLIWKDNEVQLIEIKGPNDSLSNQQLFWQYYFKELEIPASVLKVKFEDKVEA
jgi:VRR-NUC domain